MAAQPVAEIEAVVKGGLFFALQRQVRESLKMANSGEQAKLVLSMSDMTRGLREMKPHYGAHHKWAP